MVNYKPFAFIQSFFLLVDTIHEIKCMPIFKEEHYSCSLKQFVLDFCRYSCKWKQLFSCSGSGVFIKSFITTSVYGFWVNFKPCAFIQSFFFCCWKALLKLGVNQFSSIFSVPNNFLMNAIHSKKWKQIFCLLFFYSGQILC